MTDREDQIRIEISIATSSLDEKDRKPIATGNISASAGKTTQRESIDHVVQFALTRIFEAIDNGKKRASQEDSRYYDELDRLLNAKIQLGAAKFSFVRFLYHYDALQLTTLINKVIESKDKAIQYSLEKSLQENLKFIDKNGKSEELGIFDWTDKMHKDTLSAIEKLEAYAGTLKNELATDLTTKKAEEATAIPHDLRKLIDGRGVPPVRKKYDPAPVSEKLQNVVFKMQLLSTLHRSNELFSQIRIGGNTWYGIAAKIAACILCPPYGLYRLFKSMINEQPKKYLDKYPKTLQLVLDIDKEAGFNYGNREGAAPHFRSGKLFNKPVAVAGKEASHDSKEEEGESERPKQSKSGR